MSTSYEVGDRVLPEERDLTRQEIVGSVYALIWSWTRAGSGRGRVALSPLVRFDNRRGHLSDLAWFREENACLAPGCAHLAAAPDLAVEVLSGSIDQLDLIRLRCDYAAAGVREVWLVDTEDDGGPASAVVLRTPSTPMEPPDFVVVDEVDESGSLTSPLLSGLEIPLAALSPR